MAQSTGRPPGIRSQHPLWAERDAFDRRAMLTEILVQVSHEALQGDTLEAMMRATNAAPGNGGAVRAPVADATPQALIADADRALYSARHRGRDCVATAAAAAEWPQREACIAPVAAIRCLHGQRLCR